MNATKRLMASMVFRYHTWRFVSKLRRLIRKHQPLLVTISHQSAAGIRYRNQTLEVGEPMHRAPDLRTAAQRAQALCDLARETGVTLLLSSQAR